MIPVLVLSSPTSTTSYININRLYQRSYYKHKLNHHHFLKTDSSSCGSGGGGRRHISVARAMDSSSPDVAPPSSGGTDVDIDSPKGTDPTHDQVPASGYSLPDIPGWAKLVLGAVFLLALPFYRKILRIEGAIEKGAEKAAQFVEETAEEVAEFAKDVAGVLPAGPLKEKIEKIERLAVEVEKDAQVAEVVIEKVDGITDKVEAFVERSDINEKEIKNMYMINVKKNEEDQPKERR